MVEVEILTAIQVAKMLQLSKRQVYNLCRERVRVQQDFPLPRIVINSSVRFVKQDVEAWVAKLSQEKQ